MRQKTPNDPARIAKVNVRLLSQLFSLRDVRNGILGSVVVFGGIGLAI